MTPQLFQQYIDNRCTPAEGRIVEQWLRSCTEQELDELLLQSWEDNYGPMPETQAQTLRASLGISGEPARARPIKTMYRLAAAVAASVLLILAGIKWVNNKPERAPAIAAHPSPAPPAIINDWVSVTNNDSAQAMVKLDDGTQVQLFRHSGVRFLRHFEPVRREVYLQGKAMFTVAKDKRRPFTVYSGDITTTALGTVFQVNATERRPYISVHLLEGRIVVRLLKQDAGQTKDSLFLRPGDELRYNITNRTAFIQAPVSNNPNNNTTASIKDELNAISFTRTPLPEVFGKLMLQYHTTISYNKAAIATMNFTGTIAATDSIAAVLKVITQMNGLTATEKDGGFVIEPVGP